MKKYFDKYTITIWGGIALIVIGSIIIEHSGTYWALNIFRACLGIGIILGIWGIYGSWKNRRSK